ASPGSSNEKTVAASITPAANESIALLVRGESEPIHRTGSAPSVVAAAPPRKLATNAASSRGDCSKNADGSIGQGWAAVAWRGCGACHCGPPKISRNPWARLRLIRGSADVPPQPGGAIEWKHC